MKKITSASQLKKGDLIVFFGGKNSETRYVDIFVRAEHNDVITTIQLSPIEDLGFGRGYFTSIKSKEMFILE